jgi:hypothetical protein
MGSMPGGESQDSYLAELREQGAQGATFAGRICVWRWGVHRHLKFTFR